MIRIFSHYVSRVACVLLLLDLPILLLAAIFIPTPRLADSRLAPRAGDPYLSALAFALVIVFSMRALGMYRHRRRERIRYSLLGITPSFALGFALLSLPFRPVPAIHFGRLFQVLKFRGVRVVHWLRKLRIDELPQMLNVFRGEMSFVGPRPEWAVFVARLGREVPYYDVLPGIERGVTGLAQVRYRYGALVDDAVHTLQYDFCCVKNNSLFLGRLILLDAVQVVVFGKGSR